MILRDLKNYLATLPQDFDEFEMVNGEIGNIETDDKSNFMYRVDKPILAMYADTNSKEICFLNQSDEDVSNIYTHANNNSGK